MNRLEKKLALANSHRHTTYSTRKRGRFCRLTANRHAALNTLADGCINGKSLFHVKQQLTRWINLSHLRVLKQQPLSNYAVHVNFFFAQLERSKPLSMYLSWNLQPALDYRTCTFWQGVVTSRKIYCLSSGLVQLEQLILSPHQLFILKSHATKKQLQYMHLATHLMGKQKVRIYLKIGMGGKLATVETFSSQLVPVNIGLAGLEKRLVKSQKVTLGLLDQIIYPF